MLPLRDLGDHLYPVFVEAERRPYPQEKSEGQEQAAHRSRDAGSNAAYAQKRIDSRADESNAEPDDQDTDVVKNAFEQTGESRPPV